MRMLLISIASLVVAGAASASVTCVYSGFGYDSCVINNGSGTANPENFIDDATYTEDQRVYVRNVGCPPNWGDGGARADHLCPSPGEPTEIEVTDGGLVSWLRVRDSSSAIMSGGTVVWTVRSYDTSRATLSGGWIGYVYAYDSSSVTLSGEFMTSEVQSHDSSTLTMSGGTVGGDLWPQGSSTVTMSGGTVEGYLKPSDSSTVTMSGGWVSELFASGSSTVTMSGGILRFQLTAYESSTVTINGGIVRGLGATHSSVIKIEGSGFEVDGVPVPYGDLTAETGTLTGTLASGDPVEYFFYQGQAGGAFYTGTISLVEYVPEPSTAALQACALLALALLWMTAAQHPKKQFQTWT